jgi:tetratricopeptide (TPR) repeat protein
MLKVPIACLLFQAFLITPSPGNKVKTLYKEGLLCMKSGQLTAAQQCFNDVIRRDSGYTAAYLQLGTVYVLMHDLPAAKQQFLQVLQQKPAQPEAMEAMARIFFEQQQYEDVLNYTGDVSLKGLCYYNLGQHAKAISLLQKAQKEAPSDTRVLYTLGSFYFNAKDFHAAINAFELAQRKGYNMDADFHLNIGSAYLQVKQTEKGLQHLELCLVQRPEDAQALQALGHTYFTAENYNKAITYWKRLSALQPTNAFARFMLGKSYIGNGEITKGEKICDEAFN